jgi:NitT/TauT family transport system substrate-binding protein
MPKKEAVAGRGWSLLPSHRRGIDPARHEAMVSPGFSHTRARPSRVAWRDAAMSISLLFALAGAAFGQPAPAAPLQKATLALDWYPQAENAGYICAMVSGYYRAAGFDVTIRPMSMGAGSSNLSLLALGKIQFCMEGADQAIVARGRGLPVKCVMATMEHTPLALMVHAESPVKSFPDLEGHAIAVAPGFAWFEYLVRKYHLQHVSELRFTTQGQNFVEDPNYIQQCLSTSEPFFMQRRGIKVRTLMLKDTGYDAYRALLAADSYIAAHPDGVKAFVAASIQGWRTYLQDPATTDQEVMRLNPQMTQDQLTYSRRAMIENHFVDGYPGQGEDVGRLSAARMQVLYQILHDEKFIGQDYDYHDSFFAGTASP